MRYHVLLPVEDAAARVESAMGALSSGDTLVATPMVLDQDEVADIQRDLLDQARADLEAVASRASRRSVPTSTATWSPTSRSRALAAKVQGDRRGRGASSSPAPHVVAEFFHVDWTSRARRKLGVPVLHLLEHENFDEQAGGGEGVTGM